VEIGQRIGAHRGRVSYRGERGAAARWADHRIVRSRIGRAVLPALGIRPTMQRYVEWVSPWMGDEPGRAAACC
jgi:hypothetical protein